MSAEGGMDEFDRLSDIRVVIDRLDDVIRELRVARRFGRELTHSSVGRMDDALTDVTERLYKFISDVQTAREEAQP